MHLLEMPGLKAPGLAYLLRELASSPGVRQGIQGRACDRQPVRWQSGSV